MIVYEALQPHLSGLPVDHLDEVAEASSAMTASYLCFTIAQLFLIAGVIGIADLLRTRTPRLAGWAGVLGVLGAFGHAVFGGFTLVMITIAKDTAHLDVHREVLQAAQNGPIAVFSLLGLIGLIPTILLLAIALLRSRVTARWVPAALLAFLVIQGGLSGVVVWASLLSSLIAGAAFCMLAVTILRSHQEVRVAESYR